MVSTKSPRSDKQYVWEAVADSSSYVIREETDPEKLLRRGTQITLYLRVPFFFLGFLNFSTWIILLDLLSFCLLLLQPDDKFEFSEPTRIQGLVKNYSQFVSFPIYTWQEKSRTVEVRISFWLVLIPL